MNWLDRLLPPKIKRSYLPRKVVPEGVWQKCESCEAVCYTADLERNLYVCPYCNHHKKISARQRISFLLDSGSWTEVAQEIRSVDILKFKDVKRYSERLEKTKKKTGETDALLVGHGAIMDMPVALAIFDFQFMGGSMGSVVGERFVRVTRLAIERGIPLMCLTASGGARMQEGVFSLMQMAKTTAALTKLSKAGLLFVTILTNPTMGGVSASFAFLGDIVIAEPGASIGFAGPRVIERTVKETLPDHFQKSEFLLQKGALDFVVDRRQMRTTLHNILCLFSHS